MSLGDVPVPSFQENKLYKQAICRLLVSLFTRHDPPVPALVKLCQPVGMGTPMAHGVAANSKAKAYCQLYQLREPGL